MDLEIGLPPFTRDSTCVSQRKDWCVLPNSAPSFHSAPNSEHMFLVDGFWALDTRFCVANFLDLELKILFQLPFNLVWYSNSVSLHHLQKVLVYPKLISYLPWETQSRVGSRGGLRRMICLGKWSGSQFVQLNGGLFGFNQLGQKICQILMEWNDQRHFSPKIWISSIQLSFW